uniref:Uncharacterized protein n=1 Tax=Triticum urartu TaxID=4572 RepID=A0A8R7JXX1_TRIUA
MLAALRRNEMNKLLRPCQSDLMVCDARGGVAVAQPVAGPGGRGRGPSPGQHGDLSVQPPRPPPRPPAA